MQRHPEPRSPPTDPYADGASTAVLELDIAPGFRGAAERRLVSINGVIAVAPTCREHRLRVQVRATDPHALRSRIDNHVKRVPGVHGCRQLTGDGSKRPAAL